MPVINNSLDKSVNASLFAREVQVRTIQLKLTIFIIALLLFVTRPIISNQWKIYKDTQASYQKLETDYTAKVKEQQTVFEDVKVLQQYGTPTQKAVLMNCYNTNCQTLPDAIKNEPAKSIFKAYLQLQEYGTGKFIIDQKKILTYLNEFLVKSQDGTVNGMVKDISFGKTEKVVGNDRLVVVPMNVTMQFPNKNAMLGFLTNIEKLVSPLYPMLAIVQSVTYDIVKSDATQDVVVALDLYMIE